MEKYVEYLQSVLYTAYPFSKEKLNFISAHFSFESIEKGNYLVKEKESVNCMWFVCEGFFSHYRYVEEKAVIENFNGEHWFTGDFTAFITRQPSQKNIRCLQKAILLCIHYGDYMKLIDIEPGFETFARKFAETLFIRAQRRVIELLTFTPEQHYNKLLQENSQIFEKAPIQDIASYLGITKESLSRIRKRLTDRRHLNNLSPG